MALRCAAETVIRDGNWKPLREIPVEPGVANLVTVMRQDDAPSAGSTMQTEEK